ncbi:protein phosphatase 2C domain-containing protein [Coraliomargarita sp. SDUM461003]|uniref:Protein phosphatase 2C domain-containing protein n=1 Tax=Thalassobacterium maritimum TaxID=3041265 RepID=A0ABU1APC1_9BACT|nr:protein phosphatase 2C domain-containing protein [Coraliomargarita sp. SDUM461003]MBT63905.1 protein phosphatase [Puniceicoccaceae bacterium]MDQ8206018.1 protein phosphatase 2C domain-containing protein [Coraliomargarita sp. SDUM461003]HBR93585.1 serine/threonine-protein phosphatase [Opitutae bacterium]|tara:strand:+ start:458 stop:1300 length:843 start_codon:yes stop_codon:yes gene_type:complete
MSEEQQGEQKEASEICWSGLTDVGRFRKNNEDAFLALALNGEGVRRLGKYGDAGLQENDYIFAVSDGMGGANAGEFASKIAVDKITNLLPQSFRAAAGGISVGFQDLLGELFDQIHHELTHMGFCYEELRGMGATLSLCWVRPGWVYFAHVGDSRIYHLPAAGGIKQVSHDHTHVGWLQREGKLREIQARSHPGRNALQQVLGGKNQNLSPQFGAVGYEPGDAFLICSDGLVEGLWDSGMKRLIRNPPKNAAADVAQRLVREAVQTDGKDNTTALVFEMS